MNPATRSFYTRYYLLSMIAPAYVLALIFYTAAWLFSPASPLPPLIGGTIFYVGGVFVFIGISRLLAAAGFWLSGITRTVIKPTAADQRKLHEVLAGQVDLGGPALEPAESAPPPLSPQLVELGEVPYLSVGGFLPDQLWISTHTLRTMDERTLRYLTAHERGHLATSPRGCNFAWHDALWLLAYPLALLLSPLPPLIAAAGLLHAMLWLRLAHWMRLRAEVRADRWAARHTDRLGYARAMVEFHRQVAGSAGTATRLRLARLGLSSDEVNSLLS